MSIAIDEFTNDIAQQRVQLNDELIFWPQCLPDRVMYRIEVPSRHQFYTVGYEEYVFLSLLDGKTTIAEACGRTAQVLGKQALTGSKAIELVQWLYQNQLARPSDVHGGHCPVQDHRPAQSVLEKMNPFWLKIPMSKSTRSLDALASTCGWCFHPGAVFVALSLWTIAILTLVSQSRRLMDSAAEIYSPANWLWTLAAWIVLKAIHEMGHAAACRRRGGHANELGVVFVLFAPLAYVDVTTSWRLRSRWQRIGIAAAGMYFELTIAALAAIAWSWTSDPWISKLLFDVILAASVSTILFNANPLMRFDGYFILADLVDIPNLYSRGRQAVRRLALRLFYARDGQDLQVAGWRRAMINVYGIAAAIWRVFVCASLLLVAAYMFEGAGILLVAIGLLVWVFNPAVALIRSLRSTFRVDPTAGLRAAIVGTVLLLVCGFLALCIPVGSSLRAPAVVEYLDDCNIRSRVDGFIDRIHVTDGQHVTVGTPLVTLKNTELRQQIQDLQTQILQSEIRERAVMDSANMAAVQVERDSRQAIKDQLAQLRQRARSLVVRAHRDGRVVAYRLDDRRGTFVEEGEQIAIVASDSDKQLLVSISQHDIVRAMASIGQDIRLRTATRYCATGRLIKIDPLASTEVPHAALSGVNHGKLPVREDNRSADKTNLQLVEPRFQAIVALPTDTADHVPAGQTVQVDIGKHDRTMYQWLRLKVNAILRAARTQSQLAAF